MILEDMKIDDSARQGFQSIGGFSVTASRQKKPVDNGMRLIIKVGVCAAALMSAFVIRAIGQESQKTVPVSHMTEQFPESSDAIGTLRYVDAKTVKWSAPVETNDVELLRDRALLRFTATEEEVCTCIAGTVTKVASDERFGKSVTVLGADDTEIVLYGFDIVHVLEKDRVACDQVVGTVPIGRSIYLSVQKNGKPQDPSEYVDLSIRGRDAAV